MREPTVASLMTREVISAYLHSSSEDLVKLLEDKAISAIPVLVGGQLVGVVSAADLMPKEQVLSSRPDAPDMSAVTCGPEQPDGMTARDLMSTPARSVSPGTSANEAARKLLAEGLPRLFVVDDDGVLVGVLSRRDLLTSSPREDDDLKT